MTKKIRLTNKMRDVLLDKAVSIAIEPEIAKAKALSDKVDARLFAEVTFEDVLTFWADADKYRGLIVPDDKPGTALAVNMAEDVSVVMARLAKRT